MSLIKKESGFTLIEMMIISNIKKREGRNINIHKPFRAVAQA